MDDWMIDRTEVALWYKRKQELENPNTAGNQPLSCDLACGQTQLCCCQFKTVMMSNLK